MAKASLKSPFTIPLAMWALSVGIKPAHASKLAREGRITAKDGGNGAEQQGRDWFIRPGSYYEYKALGGARKNAGRPVA